MSEADNPTYQKRDTTGQRLEQKQQSPHRIRKSSFLQWCRRRISRKRGPYLMYKPFSAQWINTVTELVIMTVMFLLLSSVIREQSCGDNTNTMTSLLKVGYSSPLTLKKCESTRKNLFLTQYRIVVNMDWANIYFYALKQLRKKKLFN